MVAGHTKLCLRDSACETTKRGVHRAGGKEARGVAERSTGPRVAGTTSKHKMGRPGPVYSASPAWNTLLPGFKDRLSPRQSLELLVAIFPPHHIPPVTSGSACMCWGLPVPSVFQPAPLPHLRSPHTPSCHLPWKSLPHSWMQFILFLLTKSLLNPHTSALISGEHCFSPSR